MATADHVRDFLSPLEDDPVFALRDAFIAAGSKDPELARRLLAIGKRLQNHSLSPKVPATGPRIGNLSPQATPVFAVGYMRARQALMAGARIGDFHEAAAKAEKALSRLEADFGTELALAIDHRIATSTTFRRRVYAAAADADAGLGLSKDGAKQVETMARQAGGAPGDSWCEICVNGNCRPGTDAECIAGIIIIIIIIVTK